MKLAPHTRGRRSELVFVFIFLLCGSRNLPAFTASEVADAARNNSTNAVARLIRGKADVNTSQADGTTALHWAARWNNLEMAASLVRAGAKAQAPNRDGA